MFICVIGGSALEALRKSVLQVLPCGNRVLVNVFLEICHLEVRILFQNRLAMVYNFSKYLEESCKLDFCQCFSIRIFFFRERFSLMKYYQNSQASFDCYRH